MSLEHERHQSGLDSDSQAEAGQEIKWVYATTLPHQEGRADVGLTLGVPQDPSWLWRDQEQPSIYRFRLPLTVSAGGENTQMAVEGSIKADSSDKVVLKHLGLSQMPLDTSRAWGDNYDRVAEHLLDTICDAVEGECRNHLATHFDPATSNRTSTSS